MGTAKVSRANLIRELRDSQLLSADDHVLVAVSGGADSLYLAQWLLSGTLPADLQPRVSLAYVNHHLREDAATEAALVARFAAQHPEVPFYARDLTWDSYPTSGLEEQARTQRYATLVAVAEQIGANKLATGHHQDDQIETILYKLLRGGELSLLAGMQAQLKLSEKVTLIRPFLTLPKEKLSILTDVRLAEWVEDPTNQDEHYARNQIRQSILPAMRQINAQAGTHLLSLAADIQGLQRLSQSALTEQVQAITTGTFDWSQDHAIIKSSVAAWLKEQGDYAVKKRHLEQVIQLMQNRNISRGEIALGSGRYLVREKGQLRLVSNHD